MFDVDQKISGFVNANRKFHSRKLFLNILRKAVFRFKIFSVEGHVLNFCIAKVVDCTKCSRPAGTGVPAHLNPGCCPSSAAVCGITQLFVSFYDFYITI